MGGARCIFRDCNVSTARHPKMHFFHFPVKHKERFHKWVRMAGVDFILTLPVAQQRNRAVCSRHFRDECFMNYKCDRLVATAVPTLMRLSGRLALDYESTETGEQPVLLTLEKSQLPHLIPPAGFECPLQMGPDDEIIDIIDLQEEQAQDVDADAEPSAKRQKLLNKFTKIDSVVNCDTQIDFRLLDTTEVPAIESNADPLSPPTNADVVITNTKKNVFFVDDNDQLDIYEINMSEQSEFPMQSVAKLPTFVDKEVQAQLPQKPEQTNVVAKLQQQHKTECANLHARIQQLETEMQSVQSQLESTLQQLECARTENTQLGEQQKLLQQANRELQTKCDETKSKNTSLLNKCKNLESDNKTLNHEHKLLQREYKEQLQQVNAVSTSKQFTNAAAAARVSTSNTPAAQHSLTKTQLFNGIKRYLCATMVSLVRMEMFGGAERQWKPDEQRVAVDLLRLGEQVYKYFSDEWRFRLPAVRQVQEWLHQVHADEDDDEL